MHGTLGGECQSDTASTVGGEDTLLEAIEQASSVPSDEGILEVEPMQEPRGAAEAFPATMVPASPPGLPGAVPPAPPPPALPGAAAGTPRPPPSVGSLLPDSPVMKLCSHYMVKEVLDQGLQNLSEGRSGPAREMMEAEVLDISDEDGHLDVFVPSYIDLATIVAEDSMNSESEEVECII